VGAHGVWVEDDELALLSRARAALVHCPGSNLKLGSGLANVRAWRRAGIRAGLGSDGAACNNRLDTFHEMSLAAGISRVLVPREPLAEKEVLELATRGGAESLGLGAVTGSLEAGKQGDVMVLDVSGPHLAPNEDGDPYATIVHAARVSDVRLTMVSGRILYRDGSWPARGRVLRPGFVNTHAHLARHLARGLGLRHPEEWKRYERALSWEDVRAGVRAALVEGVRHGITTVCDFHRSGSWLDASLRAVVDAARNVGVRVATCRGAAEDDTAYERRFAAEESRELAGEAEEQ